MRITESRLRQVIREVLSEMSDLPQMSAKPELPKSKNEEVLRVQLVHGNAISEIFNGIINEIVEEIYRMGVYEVFVLEGSENARVELAKICKEFFKINCDITLFID